MSISLAQAQAMFPHTPAANIKANMPFVLAGLRWADIADRDMTLIALATIRAETEGFVPISEGRSRFNTDRGDLARARRLVNGGSHGLDRFTNAYRRGEAERA